MAAAQRHLSTRQIDALLALAEERNFTRAAAACHLSQPAFSALVSGVERALGVRLFDRGTRHVALTAEGAQFLPAVARIRGDIDTALGALHDSVALRRGRAALALLPSLAADWLPPVLAGFRAAHPGLEVDIADVLSEPCIERVAAGHADLALAAIRADTAALQAEPFCQDGFLLVCRRDHPLARPRAPVTPAALGRWPFIHLARTSSVRQYLDAGLHPQPLRPVAEVEQLATVAGLVRAGLGISAVPALAAFHLAHPDLHTRPLRVPGLQRQIYLVQRRGASLSLAASALKAALLAARPVG